MAYQNLKAEMARNDVSQEDVAIAAGVSTRTVYNWLKDESRPDIEQCKQMQRSLFPNLSLDYLFA